MHLLLLLLLGGDLIEIFARDKFILMHSHSITAINNDEIFQDEWFSSILGY